MSPSSSSSSAAIVLVLVALMVAVAVFFWDDIFPTSTEGAMGQGGAPECTTNQECIDEGYAYCHEQTNRCGNLSTYCTDDDDSNCRDWQTCNNNTCSGGRIDDACASGDDCESGYCFEGNCVQCTDTAHCDANLSETCIENSCVRPLANQEVRNPCELSPCVDNGYGCYVDTSGGSASCEANQCTANTHCDQALGEVCGISVNNNYSDYPQKLCYVPQDTTDEVPGGEQEVTYSNVLAVKTLQTNFVKIGLAIITSAGGHRKTLKGNVGHWGRTIIQTNRVIGL